MLIFDLTAENKTAAVKFVFRIEIHNNPCVCVYYSIDEYETNDMIMY